MAGSAQIGETNDGILLLVIPFIFLLPLFRVASLFWELPKASLKSIGTDLSGPSMQLCLWHLIKLLLTKGFYWKIETFFLTLRSLNIAGALTWGNSHISFVFSFFFNTTILRGRKPFRGLCEKKVSLDWVYNPCKFDFYLLHVHLMAKTSGAISPMIILWLWQNHDMTPARGILSCCQIDLHIILCCCFCCCCCFCFVLF